MWTKFLQITAIKTKIEAELLLNPTYSGEKYYSNKKK